MSHLDNSGACSVFGLLRFHSVGILDKLGNAISTKIDFCTVPLEDYSDDSSLKTYCVNKRFILLTIFSIHVIIFQT